MADFQYQPDMSDPVAKLRLAMDTMDGNVTSVSRLFTTSTKMFGSQLTQFVRIQFPRRRKTTLWTKI